MFMSYVHKENLGPPIESINEQWFNTVDSYRKSVTLH